MQNDTKHMVAARKFLLSLDQVNKTCLLRVFLGTSLTSLLTHTYMPSQSVAVHAICFAVCVKLERNCRRRYQEMVHARASQHMHTFSGQKEGLEESKSSIGGQQQLGSPHSQQQQQQQQQQKQPTSMEKASKFDSELEYAAWVQGSYGQVALGWPLFFGSFFGIYLFSDITNLANVTLGAPLLALCLYQYYVTKKGWTLQVRLWGRQ